ncbi:uncharacterized protein LOC114576370 [Exaiptasia diaphana]|uniref:Apple domain-containing protein n=1 Tax=Exaiptasia diaphana TaxID=2652724 RepID=A0A913YU35_EXADI|nr:uncharacterized protein LOC114576370 [Exaiptasia diaphana]
MKNKAFSLLLITTGVVFSQNLINVDQLWSSSSVFETNKDYALFGHVIKTLYVQFVAECIQECQNTLECFSYNYVYFQNGTSDHLCELNLSNKNQSKSSYIPLHGYQYGEPQDFQYCVGDECVKKNALADKWYRINGSLLKTIYSIKNWADARSYCRSIGGDLMTVHSQIENKFVKSVLMYREYMKCIRMMKI